jgi:hypothetical protein
MSSQFSAQSQRAGAHLPAPTSVGPQKETKWSSHNPYASAPNQPAFPQEQEQEEQEQPSVLHQEAPLYWEPTTQHYQEEHEFAHQQEQESIQSLLQQVAFTHHFDWAPEWQVNQTAQPVPSTWANAANPMWAAVMYNSPHLMEGRDFFKNHTKPLYDRDSFVEWNLGQSLTLYGPQVVGFVALKLGFEAFAAFEQGSGTVRFLILKTQAHKLRSAIKRHLTNPSAPGFKDQANFINPSSVELHIRCTTDGIAFYSGPGAVEESNASAATHRGPRSTLDITESHDGNYRVKTHRVEKRNKQEQQSVMSQSFSSRPSCTGYRNARPYQAYQARPAASYAQTQRELKEYHGQYHPQYHQHQHHQQQEQYNQQYSTQDYYGYEEQQQDSYPTTAVEQWSTQPSQPPAPVA